MRRRNRRRSVAGTRKGGGVTTFLELHRPGAPLLMPNPWDVGSAMLLESLGFEALATTSSGFAATLGGLDGSVTRDQAIAHARALVGAVDVPVSADLENCFADDPAGVAETIGLAVDAGLAGCSIEDFTRRPDDPIYELGASVERVAAAAERAHAGPSAFVLTARCENFVHGRADLAGTIARLQAYQEAGADVLFATGVSGAGDIRSIVSSVDRPYNVLVTAASPTVAELAAMGVARISVGGAFAYAAMAAVIDAARELRDQGTYGYTAKVPAARTAARAAFSSR
jgi:2-methylisocitrate lyase-like PEP mutase family enzyme